MDEFKKELEDYFCRFTFGQFVTLILLEIVTLFFVFYLGARYGPDLMGRRDDVAKESVLPNQNPKSVDDIVGKPSVEYTYPEVLTSPDGRSTSGGAVRVKPSGVTSEEYDRQKREMPREPAPNPPVVKETTPPKPEKPEAKPEAKPEVRPEVREEPVVEKEAPAEPVKEKPTQEVTAKPKAKFSVQVGAYQSQKEASTSLGHWKKKGYSAFMAVGQVPDKGTWYRVRIGGFGSKDDAQKFLLKLKEKEKVSALVVLSNS